MINCRIYVEWVEKLIEIILQEVLR